GPGIFRALRPAPVRAHGPRRRGQARPSNRLQDRGEIRLRKTKVRERQVTPNTLFNLESMLQQLIVEHRKLLRHVESYQNAMKKIDLDAMDQAARQQQASRLRIGALEMQRRAVVVQLAKQYR